MPEITPSPIYAFCETYLCKNRSRYRITKPDGPLRLGMNLCEECAKKIILSGLELFPELIPEKEPQKEEKKTKPEEKPTSKQDLLRGRAK